MYALFMILIGLNTPSQIEVDNSDSTSSYLPWGRKTAFNIFNNNYLIYNDLIFNNEIYKTNPDFSYLCFL